MTIRDELMGHSVTTIEFDSPGLKELPDSVFDLNLLTQ